MLEFVGEEVTEIEFVIDVLLCLVVEIGEIVVGVFDDEEGVVLGGLEGEVLEEGLLYDGFEDVLDVGLGCFEGLLASGDDDLVEGGVDDLGAEEFELGGEVGEHFLVESLEDPAEVRVVEWQLIIVDPATDVL